MVVAVNSISGWFGANELDMSFRSVPAASLPQGSLGVGSRADYLELSGFKSNTWPASSQA